MRRRISVTLLIRLTIVAVVLCSAAILLGRSTSQSNHQAQSVLNTESAIQSPTVFVESQTGSPLSIVLIEIKQAGGGASELVFDLTNTATKTIRAYSIQQRVTVEEKQRTEAVINDLGLSDSSLLPAGSRREAAIVDAQAATPNIALSVDFVEFVDGTTWGADSSASSERLKGQRAGFAFSASRLKEKFKSEGAVGLTRALEEDPPRRSTSSDHSSTWEAGFRAGELIAIRRIRKSIEEGDIKQVEALLYGSTSRKEPQ